jgi:biotin carboxyl carrier protein
MVTLESMKMLTPVVAPSAGTVTEIAVAVDDFVDESGLLVRLDV